MGTLRYFLEKTALLSRYNLHIILYRVAMFCINIRFYVCMILSFTPLMVCSNNISFNAVNQRSFNIKYELRYDLIMYSDNSCVHLNNSNVYVLHLYSSAMIILYDTTYNHHSRHTQPGKNVMLHMYMNFIEAKLISIIENTINMIISLLAHNPDGRELLFPSWVCPGFAQKHQQAPKFWKLVSGFPWPE